jgi:hypothetical protein
MESRSRIHVAGVPQHRRNFGIRIRINESCISSGGIQRLFRKSGEAAKGGSLQTKDSEM